MRKTLTPKQVEHRKMLNQAKADSYASFKKEFAATTIVWSIAITLSIILTAYKLGFGQTSIVNWSWGIVATPPIAALIFYIVKDSVPNVLYFIFG